VLLYQALIKNQRNRLFRIAKGINGVFVENDKDFKQCLNA